MRNLIFTAILLTACVVLPSCDTVNTPTLPLATHPDSASWQPLFGEGLEGAKFPTGVWSFNAEGVLSATKDKTIWTSREYDNFVLDMEFKTDEETNSGVIVYCSDRDKWIPNSVEIQIADDFAPKWAKSDKTWQCAAIFGHQAATESKVKHPGLWNRYTITCADHIITVILNGTVVNTFDMRKFTSAKTNPNGSRIPPWLSVPKAKMPTKGYIGLQGKHGKSLIYFRNLRIFELTK